MQAAQAYQQYKNLQAQTADGGELVVMLYQGAIKFISRAVGGLATENVEETHNNLVNAQAVIAELTASLNPEAGEIARNLSRLYEYMNHRLVEANLRKNPEPAEEVLGLLRELLPAWQQAAAQVRTEKSAQESSTALGRAHLSVVSG
jgi:flagellar protein FliS